MYTTLLAALAAAPAVNALGNAIVQNKCSGPAYLWSVDIDSQTEHTIPAGGSYSEAYRSPSNGGVSIKISNEPLANAYVGDAITQFEYTLASDIFYDISNINGYPFMASGVTLTPGESSCPSKVCPAGVELCGDAYNVFNDDHATGACSANSDTTLVLCSDNASAPAAAAPKAAAAAPKKVVEPVVAAPKAASTPKPAATSAPAAAAPSSAAPTHMTAVPAAIPVVEAAPDAGVFTTFVTQIITIAVRDAAPEPTAVPAKRDDAADAMHKRAAHRHHFHRHAEEEQQ